MFRFSFLILLGQACAAQLSWQNADSLYQPLPASVHVYKTTSLLDGKPHIAYYVEADLKDRSLEFTTDTTYKRRLKPSEFYSKNGNPLVVVNCTFFSFATNQNLNLVMRNGKLLGYNIHSIAGKGKDTFTYRHPLGSALGIDKNRRADVAWVYTDSSLRHAYASEMPFKPIRDSADRWPFRSFLGQFPQLAGTTLAGLKKHTRWKMRTAVGGGPVILQKGEIMISNNEELKFAGKAIEDKHPRTAMGYTRDGKLIILAIQGRFPGIAEGATLEQEARMLKDIGCVEALNLDGGGSSCLLVNGKPTITVSDKEGQRPVPAVFIIK